MQAALQERHKRAVVVAEQVRDAQRERRIDIHARMVGRVPWSIH
jgi:hypothetical protein